MSNVEVCGLEKYTQNSQTTWGGVKLGSVGVCRFCVYLGWVVGDGGSV